MTPPAAAPPFAFALEAATLRNAEVMDVRAGRDEHTDATVVPMADWTEIEEEERQILADQVSAVAAGFPGVHVRRHVVMGRTAQALVLAAADTDAQLLVVGQRPRNTMITRRIGSIRTEVLRHARSPVAVVRTLSDGASLLRSS